MHLVEMRYLTVAYTTPYLYDNENVSVVNTLRAGDFPGLSTVFGEIDATREQFALFTNSPL